LYPLQIVAGALVDADRGVSTAAFKPQKPSARPPLSVVQSSLNVVSGRSRLKARKPIECRALSSRLHC
jgi:hypothetical protein